ncbi:MAG TPA: HAD family hydrolase [Blastocatellia bacterium]|nr:HAD family hydrolase [Blastocatellia bacterium]
MKGYLKDIEAVFFDVRDTLGVVDRKGHLVKYKPTTDQLLEAMKQSIGLRIGLITNLPDNVSREDGVQMVKEVGIWDFLDPKGFITNKEAGAEKPQAGIYEYAARQMGLSPDKCLFVGENLIEVIGAHAAGMRAVLKPFPPGREFLQKSIKAQAPNEKSSGRLSELILEEEHLIAKRIVICAAKIGERLRNGEDPTQGGQPLLRPMSMLVWLTNNFIDPFHHRKEEEVLAPFGVMLGLDPNQVGFISLDHEQGRNYFRGLDIALRRVRAGDSGAVREFSHLLSGMVDLYQSHGKKEDDEIFKKIGDLLTDSDDALMVDLMSRIGPVDITLYLAAIANMEKDLGL